jgi:hypothetical protein
VDSPAVGLFLARPGRIRKPAQRALEESHLRSGLDRKPTIIVTSLKVCLSKINLISLFIGKNSLFIDFA